VYRSNVTVTLRKSILDPQGKAVEQAVHSLGFTTVQNLRIGKHVEFLLESPSQEEAERVTEQVCKKLLANPVMEDYSFLVKKL
jgi:phosphoribosylformylglycinamidine synthase subunit PurS